MLSAFVAQRDCAFIVGEEAEIDALFSGFGYGLVARGFFVDPRAFNIGSRRPFGHCNPLLRPASCWKSDHQEGDADERPDGQFPRAAEPTEMQRRVSRSDSEAEQGQHDRYANRVELSYRFELRGHGDHASRRGEATRGVICKRAGFAGLGGYYPNATPRVCAHNIRPLTWAGLHIYCSYRSFAAGWVGVARYFVAGNSIIRSSVRPLSRSIIIPAHVLATRTPAHLMFAASGREMAGAKRGDGFSRRTRAKYFGE